MIVISNQSCKQSPIKGKLFVWRKNIGKCKLTFLLVFREMQVTLYYSKCTNVLSDEDLIAKWNI